MSDANFTDINSLDGATASPEISDSGVVENHAINSASQAREIYRRLREDDLRSRDIRRGRVLKAFNGNAPQDPGYLKDQGMDWYPNVSMNTMAGIVGRAEVPYLDFGADVRYMAAFGGQVEDEKLDVMREEFTRSVKKWGGWMRQFTRLVRELNLNGWACYAFLDEYTPWPRMFPQNRCFVPEGSPNDVNDVDVIVLERYYLLHELFSYIDNPEAAERAGWNVDNVRKCIMNARPRELNKYRSWEELQKQIRDGFLYHSYTSSRVIRVGHVLARELDGGVSHWMVEDVEGSVKKVYNDEDNSQLFKSEKQFESMDECVVYFDAEPGDGHFTGSRGVGQRSYNTHTQRDKLMNQMLATAYTSGLTLLEVPDEIRGQALDLMVASPFVQVPSGVKPLMDAFPKLTPEVMQMDQMITNSSEQSLGDVVPSPGGGISQEKETATGRQIDASRQIAIQRSTLKRFTDPYSKTLWNIFTRLSKPNNQQPAAKLFQKKCLDRGVDIRIYIPLVEVRGFYDIKDITGEAGQSVGVAFQMFRGDPAVDQRNLYQRQLRQLLGPEAVLELMPPDANQADEIAAERIQLNEIATMMSGMEVPVIPSDRHEFQAPVALMWMLNKIKESQAGQPGVPPDVLKRVFEHFSAHVQAMSQSPDKRIKALAQQLAQQAQPIAQLLQMIENAQMQQAQLAKLQARAVGAAPAPALEQAPQLAIA